MLLGTKIAGGLGVALLIGAIALMVEDFYYRADHPMPKVVEVAPIYCPSLEEVYDYYHSTVKASTSRASKLTMYYEVSGESEQCRKWWEKKIIEEAVNHDKEVRQKTKRDQ